MVISINSNYIIRIFVIIISIVYLTNCEKEERTLTWSEMYSNIDSTKIDQIISNDELKIVFHPPLGWKSMSAELSEKYESRSHKKRADKEKFIYKPKHVFYNIASKGLLSIGEVTSIDTIKIDLLKKYDLVTQSTLDTNEVQTYKFNNNGIAFIQHITKKVNLISYKLIFYNSDYKILQFEYSTPKKQFPGEKNRIESSIGTIKLN